MPNNKNTQNNENPTTPAGPSLIEAAIEAVLGYKNWDSKGEAFELRERNMRELEAALRFEGHGVRLDEALEKRKQLLELAELELPGGAGGGIGAYVRSFWETTEPFGWGTKTTDANAIKAALLHQITPEKAEQMQRVFQALVSDLDTRLEAWRKANPTAASMDCGDDSYSDLLAHVVGLGRGAFTEARLHPHVLVKRCNAGEYVESFAYALPHAQDFVLLDLEQYETRTEALQQQYGWLCSAAGLEADVLRHAQRLCADLHAIRTQHFMNVPEKEGDLRASAHAVARYLEEHAFLRRAIRQGGPSITNKHILYNLLSDLTTYYIPFQNRPA